MVDRRRLLRVAWDVWRTGRETPSAIARRRQARLADLIEFARTRSPYYAKLYSQLPLRTADLQRLPPVRKPELMAMFDDWVTDPEVTRSGVKTFVADKTRAGHLYLDRYAVWTSSGITGEPGIFVIDGGALTVYWALTGVRDVLSWMTPGELWAVRRRGGGRVAILVATGGHFVGVTYTELYRRLRPRMADRTHTFSVMMPLADLVRSLNDFQPNIVMSYPTMIAVLAHEQSAGRLQINPISVTTGGEWLSTAIRNEITAGFNCPVRDAYAASEFMGIALQCRRGCLHLNSDWVILEAVDDRYRPVPPGQASHTSLLTNLANRLQPMIRYDLGDTITVSPDACACGSPFPVIYVEGRREDILAFQAAGGEVVRMVPRVIAEVVVPGCGAASDTTGVRRFQLIQVGPEMLRVRLEIVPGADDRQVWETTARRLREYLAAQGLPTVEVERDPEAPRSDPKSGKFRQVWADLDAAKRQVMVS